MSKHAHVSQSTIDAWARGPIESRRTARRITVSNEDTDHATGHCECSACGEAIDPWDAYCRHCGAWLEDE